MTTWRYYTVDANGNRVIDPEDFLPPPDEQDELAIYRRYGHRGGRNLLVCAALCCKVGEEIEAWAFFRKAVPELVGVLPEEVPIEMRETIDPWKNPEPKEQP